MLVSGLQVCYTGTNSVVCVLSTMKWVFQTCQAKITDKFILTTHSIVFPRIGIGTCTGEYIKQQYLVLEVSVNLELVQF